jgi:hypothetical protein
MRYRRVERAGRGPLAVSALLAATLLLAMSASASTFNSTTTASQSIASATLAAPTGLTATCVSLSSNVTLNWTATSSTFATGYEVLSSTTTGGPYTPVAPVSGRTTTTYTDTINLLQTKYWVVEATVDTWTSLASNQAGLRSLGLGLGCSAA